MIKKLLLFVICFLTFSFANAQLNSVAIVGYGTLNGWPKNTPGEVDAHQMNTTDGVHWTLNNLFLVGGDIKLRGNNSWNPPYDWGGTGFPSGAAQFQGAAIQSLRGVYNVTFNSNTLEYTFVKTADAIQVISIIGNATPGGWEADTDMATTDGNIYTLNNVSLTAGDLKLRGDHRWENPYDWGGTGFPSGTAVVAPAPAITVPTAGTYSITFNKTTLAYNITSTLDVNNFETITFKVYPNPTQDNWIFNSSTENIESIVIVDITGKTVKTAAPKSNQATIDASGLTAGLYIAKITTATAAQTLKLIKQ